MQQPATVVPSMTSERKLENNMFVLLDIRAVHTNSGCVKITNTYVNLIKKQLPTSLSREVHNPSMISTPSSYTDVSMGLVSNIYIQYIDTKHSIQPSNKMDPSNLVPAFVLKLATFL